MDDFVKNFSNMMENKEIPDNIKDMLSSLMNNSTKNENSNKPNNNIPKDSTPNIDINTILKMQEIMRAMNNEESSYRANLLRSLKPYLKPSRQEKIDQYIQLFNMEKVIELFNNNGGDKKWFTTTLI